MKQPPRLSAPKKDLKLERKAIYDFLREEGFEITEERHIKLRSLLKEYVNAKTRDLQRRVNVISNNIYKIEHEN